MTKILRRYIDIDDIVFIKVSLFFKFTVTVYNDYISFDPFINIIKYSFFSVLIM